MLTMTRGDHALLARFLDVYNAALSEYAAALPPQELVLGELVLGAVLVGVTVHAGDDPHGDPRPLACYSVRYADGALEPLGLGYDRVDFTWELGMDTICRVLGDPARCLCGPDGLDWSWVQALGARGGGL